MPFFKKKDTSYLGIDLGGSTIKVVELREEKKNAYLSTYGYAAKPLQDIGDSFLDHPEEMGKMLTELCKKSHTTTKRAVTALPAPAVFSSIINLPGLTKADLKSKQKIDEAVRYEAKKVIPLPIEEMILDWKPLPEEIVKKELGGYQVLLTGAAKKLVKKYMNIFDKAGLELLSLETESFALTRSLVGNDKSVVMIVDIGATSTYILIVDHGVPFLDRTINTAGIDVTRAIADVLNISVDQAEQFKFDYANAPHKLNGDRLPESLKNPFAPIIHEINYCFNLYQQDQYGGKEIDKIILSGGTALLPNIKEHLAKLLNKNVYVGDPWSQVTYPSEMKPILQGIGAKFAISIGLAMRDID